MPGPALLCTTNFPANTGYAWAHIERLYAKMADHLVLHGISTLVAYPSISSAPTTLKGSAARAIELDTSLNTRESVCATTELIRRENVQVVYFTDHPAISSAYLKLRWAGARKIIVHDHTSGERTRPKGLKYIAKWFRARIPWIVADLVIAVSTFVARREVEVTVLPPSKVIAVPWGLPVTAARPERGAHARQLFGIPLESPLIVCACRASPEKGVAHLLRAFNNVRLASTPERQLPVLLYLGDGPQLEELQKLRDGLEARDRIIFGAYRPDAAEIMEGADICVLPSIWQDAFPLSVLQPMALGKAVIATRVGGIPEMIEHGVHGLLVAPQDEVALTRALLDLVSDPARRARLGRSAQARVSEQFTPERLLGRLGLMVGKYFGIA